MIITIIVIIKKNNDDDEKPAGVPDFFLAFFSRSILFMIFSGCHWLVLPRISRRFQLWCMGFKNGKAKPWIFGNGFRTKEAKKSKIPNDNGKTHMREFEPFKLMRPLMEFARVFETDIFIQKGIRSLFFPGSFQIPDYTRSIFTVYFVLVFLGQDGWD